jgi:hypothetical protein
MQWGQLHTFVFTTHTHNWRLSTAIVRPSETRQQNVSRCTNVNIVWMFHDRYQIEECRPTYLCYTHTIYRTKSTVCVWTKILNTANTEVLKQQVEFEAFFFHSVQKNFSSRLLSENVRIKILVYKIIGLISTVLCLTWFPILREETRLKVFDTECRGKYLDLRNGRMNRITQWGFHNLYSSPHEAIIRMIKWRRLKHEGQ